MVRLCSSSSDGSLRTGTAGSVEDIVIGASTAASVDDSAGTPPDIIVEAGATGAITREKDGIVEDGATDTGGTGAGLVHCVPEPGAWIRKGRGRVSALVIAAKAINDAATAGREIMVLTAPVF